MVAAASNRRRAGTAPAGDDGRGRESSCGACQTRVRVVLLADGAEVEVDTDRDDAGDVHATRIGGRWVWRMAVDAHGPGMRYRLHRCRGTRLTAYRAGRTEGPCAARCGCRVERYGRNARPFCDPCTKRLEAWRANPVGPFPTGSH